MKLSGAQSRAVELLAGEEGWVRRGAIAKSTMDVLERLDMVERRWDDAIQRATYRATQNARDWVRGQQEDATPETSAKGARVTAETHAGCGGPASLWRVTDGLWRAECPCGASGEGPVASDVLTALGHGTDDVPEATHEACGMPRSLHCRQCPTCPVEGEACGCPVADMAGTVPAAWLMVVTDSDGTYLGDRAALIEAAMGDGTGQTV